MKIDIDRILTPLGVGMGKDIHLVHLLIVLSGIFLGHWSCKYLSKREERFETFYIVSWVILGIPIAYFLGNFLTMFLYPFELERPEISNKQFAFTSFYFMLFSIGAFIRGIWKHQKLYKSVD